MRPEGVEPPTYWFVASCSIQLSYGRTLQKYNGFRITNLVGWGKRECLSMRRQVVRPEGLEPPTLWFEARCSIQLSYGRV